jgi:chaperonin GroEL
MREGYRYIAAGGDSMALRHNLETALKLVLSKLEKLAKPIQSSAQVRRLALTICSDADLANALGEIIDVVGASGLLEFRKAQGRALKIEYREGNYWQNSGFLSTVMINDQTLQRAYVEDVFILVTDLVVEKNEDLIPVFSVAQQAGAKRLILITKKIEDSAMGTLMLPKNRAILEVFGAKTPGISSEDQLDALDELRIITGAIPLVGAAGDTWAQLTPEHLGQARRAWINKNYLGIINGKTDSIELRGYLQKLQRKYELAEKVADKNDLQTRMGRLQGGSAMLFVAGATETEIETRLELAKKTAQALRSAMRDGVVPGGGSALLACCPLLEDLADSAVDADLRAAYRIVSQALQQPFEVIAENAGVDMHTVAVARQTILEEPDRFLSFDVMKKKVVEPFESGLLDSAGVTKAALRSAITSAALALTVDVVVHQKNPPQVLET